VTLEASDALVAISTEHESVPSSADEVQIGVSLPQLDGVEAAAVASDGTVTYATNESTVLAVQSLIDGVRFLTVLDAASAPSAFDYELDLPLGAQLDVTSDGGIDITSSEGDAIGTIDAPWAIDANGVPVATHYRVNGFTVTQVVKHTEGDYTYPITADPRVSLGKGVYISMTGGEIKTIASAIIVSGGVSAIAVCSGGTKIPHALARFAAVVCTAVGAPTLKLIYQGVLAVWKTGKIETGACYQARFVVSPKAFTKVAAKNCVL
jgi:hypothetical protein